MLFRSFAKILLFSGIFVTQIFASVSNFVFNDDLIFIPKSSDFVEKVSTELYNKTGVSLYVYMSKSLNHKDYKEFRDEFVTKLQKPYISIILIKNDKKIDIVTSSEDLLDKKKVYWEYMVPLLPLSDDELTPQALSAVVFNGYVEIVDLVADKFGVVIAHNIPKDEKGPKLIAQMILYIMLFSLIIIFLVGYFIKDKYKGT